MLALGLVLASVPFEHGLHGVGSAAHQDAGSLEHAPCPDQTPTGEPCGEGCACLCCPGHGRLLLPRAGEGDPPRLIPSGTLCPGRSRIHPSDVFFSIFRPPRA